jgi:ATP-binding protein involved in chromosome partitioning
MSENLCRCHSVNLAVALSKTFELHVGVVDADVAGPSIPRMMNLEGLRAEATRTVPSHLVPLQSHGIKCMSMGFLVDPGKAIAWRGPMVVKALEQLIFDVVWGRLDVLLVDMPPGTGTETPTNSWLPLR